MSCGCPGFGAYFQQRPGAVLDGDEFAAALVETAVVSNFGESCVWIWSDAGIWFPNIMLLITQPAFPQSRLNDTPTLAAARNSSTARPPSFNDRNIMSICFML